MVDGVVCGGRITDRYVGSGRSDLRCQRCKSDEHLVKEETWAELRRQGVAIPTIIEQQFSKREERMAEERRAQTGVDTRELDLSDPVAIAEALPARFPQDLANNPRMARILAAMAVRYGLDPFANHLTIYEGQPYVTMQGRIFLAQRDPRYKGMSKPRFLGTDEKVGMGYDVEDIVCEIEVKVDGYVYPIIDYGRVKREEIAGEPIKSATSERVRFRSAVAKDRPTEMAIARARQRVLRAAGYGPGIAGLEEAGTDDLPELDDPNIIEGTASDLGTERRGTSDPTSVGHAPASAPPTAAAEEPAHPQVDQGRMM